jgi:TetR/AcrR family transcriptional regulator, mexJK operon transcriptional repressor
MSDHVAPQELRRSAFVTAAREAFFTHGYAGTTMSSIATVVGGSKTTLWSYFPSKQDLFVAVVDDLVETYGAALEVPLDPHEPLEPALRRFAQSMMRIVTSPPIIDLHRLVTGEAGRFPELGALFYERGPRRGKLKLAAYLTEAMADGRVRAGDPHVAAQQFAVMCQSGAYQHMMLGLLPSHDDTAIAADIETAIATFMGGWVHSSL